MMGVSFSAKMIADVEDVAYAVLVRSKCVIRVGKSYT